MTTTRLERPARTIYLGYAYAGLVVLLWAGFSLASRHAALQSGPRLTPWDVAALRYSVALPIALVMYAAGPGRGLPPRRSLVVAVVAGLCFPLPAYLGFSYAPAAHAAVITSGSLPFVVAIGLAMIGAERPSRARIASLLVLLLGLALLADAAFLRGGRPDAWRGDLLFLVAVTAWAAFTILARLWALTPWQVVCTVGIWAGLAYLPVWALLLPSNMAAVPLPTILFQAVVQGLLVTVLSVVLYTRALQLIGPERVATVAALVPGVAGALAVPLLGESIDGREAVGLVLVCAAVTLGVGRTRTGIGRAAAKP